ncbi:MAG: DUF2125 domain-containing protein [Alphaproteobacteria bacterium]|nr:DUF2125 domain-containing protein [Alphaproteobacteria bacterium]
MAKKRGISIILIFLPVLALLVVLSYIPFWFRASEIAQDKLIGHIEGFQEKGYQVEYSELLVEGFPLTVELTLKDLHVTSPIHKNSKIAPWQWATPQLDVVLLPLKPSEISVKFAKENEIFPGNEKLPEKLNLTFDIARFNLNKDQKDILLDLIIEAKNVNLSGFEEGSITIEELTTFVNKTKNIVRTNKDPSYSFTADLTNLNLAAMLSTEKLNKNIDSIKIDSLILGKSIVRPIKKAEEIANPDENEKKEKKVEEIPEDDNEKLDQETEEERKRRLRKKQRKNKVPFIKKMASWQKNNGSIEIKEFSMKWGDLRSRMKGSLVLNDQLQPQATLEGKTMGLFKVIDIYVKAGLIRSRDATMTKLILGRIATKPEGHEEYVVKTPLHMKEQIVYIGPLCLFKIPYIYWLGGHKRYYSGLTMGMQIDESGNVVMQDPSLESLIEEAKQKQKHSKLK